jgi:DNA-binding LacI/PurR family transcriptional regulator
MPEMLGKLGLRVPEDIGFGSLDRSPDDHSVAGLDQSYERIGSTAVDLVVSHLQRNEYGPLEAPNLTLVTGRWVSGDTLIQQPSAKKKQAGGR